MERRLPDDQKEVAVWLESVGEGNQREDLIFARLSEAGASPLWRCSRGRVLGGPGSAWRVTHWKQADLAAGR